jgi:CHRD domain-containing protein
MPMVLALCAALASLVGVASGASAAPTGNTLLRATLSAKYLHTTSTGSGTAIVTVTPTKVCWKFTYRGLDQAGDSGIHIVPPPAAGKHKHSVFPFTASTSTTPGCVSKTKWGPSGPGWVDKIVANPSHFYVIVATKKYPQGAIGGVLRSP